MQTRFLLLSILLCLFFLFGCAAETPPRGRDISRSAQVIHVTLAIGKTTTQEVSNALGIPESHSSWQPEASGKVIDKWSYDYADHSKVVSIDLVTREGFAYKYIWDTKDRKAHYMSLTFTNDILDSAQVF